MIPIISSNGIFLIGNYGDAENKVELGHCNVPNVIFCISEYEFDNITIESEAGVQLIKSSKRVMKNFIKL